MSADGSGVIFRLSELQPPVRKPANIPASESEATKIANWRSRAEANLLEWERYHCNGWWSSDKDSDCADASRASSDRQPRGRGNDLVNNCIGSALTMSRVWAMPNANTFDIEPIHNFVWKYLSQAKVSIDPFSRNRRWATYTNDLNPETEAESHVEALEFLESLRSREVRADLAIFDPPYSLEQCARSYQNVGRHVTERDTQIFGRWTDHRHVLSKILSEDAVVLSFGWNSSGMAKKHGFALEELMLVCHGGGHNDTICIAERRVQIYKSPVRLYR